MSRNVLLAALGWASDPPLLLGYLRSACLVEGRYAYPRPACMNGLSGTRGMAMETDEEYQIPEALQAEAERLRNIPLQIELGQPRPSPVQEASGV
jgi:hypothetical protein